MKIVFRVDASNEIGTGHLVRCLTLASIFKKKSNRIFLICTKNSFKYKDIIKQEGRADYKILEIEKKSKLQFLSTEQDIKATINILKKIKPELLVVDNYSIGIDWEKKIRPFVKKIMIIDDLNNRKHDCDIYLNQNFGFNYSQGKKLLPSKCIKLIGPKYAIIRKEFKKLRKLNYDYKIRLEKLFVFLGGSASQKIIFKILNILSFSKKKWKKIYVVVGLNIKMMNFFKKFSNIVLINYTKNIPNLISKCDFAITSGGTILWEKCVLGTPSITIPLSKNQILNSKLLEKKGGTIFIKKFENLENKLNNLQLNELKKISTNSLKVCDGDGLNRIKKITDKII